MGLSKAFARVSSDLVPRAALIAIVERFCGGGFSQPRAASQVGKAAERYGLFTPEEEKEASEIASQRRFLGPA
jgi:hypothetical protein